MGHVYGDSTPFPYDVNFIEQIRKTVECGVALVQAQDAIRESAARADNAEAQRKSEQERVCPGEKPGSPRPRAERIRSAQQAEVGAPRADVGAPGAHEAKTGAETHARRQPHPRADASGRDRNRRVHHEKVPDVDAVDLSHTCSN